MSTTPTQVAFYPVGGEYPPAGVMVRVVWDGRGADPARPLIAKRVVVKGRGCERRSREWASEAPRRVAANEMWVVIDNGREIAMPAAGPVDPKRPWIGWHTLRTDAPDYWAPLVAEKWQAGLPPPAFVATSETETVPRLFAERQSFAAVDDAEAEDLAREMDRDRADARDAADADRRRGRKPAEAPDPQWWLDPYAVTRSAPGAISLRETEGRVMRAELTERWERFDKPRCGTFGGVLAGLIKPDGLAAHELAALDPVTALAEPTQADRGDWPVVIEWMRAVASGRARAVIRLRAAQPAMTWTRIGEIVSASREGALDFYARALDDLHASANGRPSAGADAVKARLERVRVVNRTARG